jgi:hypothetical protein
MTERPMSVTEDEAMMAALLDAHNGDVTKAAVDWQKIRAEADMQLERELEAAKHWAPKVTVEPLTPAERHKLAVLLDGRLKNKPTVGAVKRWREDKSRAWALAALEKEAETVASTANGMRHNVLNSSTWTLARPATEGLLTGDEIERTLVGAAVETGLTERDARQTVRGALRKRGRI